MRLRRIACPALKVQLVDILALVVKKDGRYEPLLIVILDDITNLELRWLWDGLRLVDSIDPGSVAL
jgi:hypothetical protein